MATAFPAYLKAPVPQHGIQFDPRSPIVLPKQRSPSESYYSSYGESEGTPTPKRRKAKHSYSRPGFSSDPSSPTFYSTPPSAQVPRESTMEESGSESDEIYDQFDLGDFTKEEIRRYEAMVGPGERLRDATSPEELSGLAPPTADTFKDLDTSVTKELPARLHDMLRAALSNAIYQVPEMLPAGGWGQHDEVEDELDRFVDYFMQKLSEPVPQMERFIRGSQVRKDLCENAVGAPLNNLRYSYGPWISVKTAQRIFEQEVYDFGRSIGLSKQQAVGHVIKARECTSKYDIDMPELGDYESSECEDILNYLDTHSKQLLAKSNSEGAKQVKCYLQTLEVNDRRKYDWILLQLEFLGDEPLLDSVDFLREGIANMEAVDKAEEEKAAREDAKKVHTAQLQAQKEVSRHAEKKHNHKDNEHQAGRPGKQKHLTNNSEHAPNVQPFEDQDKPMKQKKKGKKRKSEPEPSVRSEAPSEENQRHRKIRVDRVAQEANCKKTSRKRITGPQHSPFFQRGSDHRAKKKDGVKKAELQVGFQPPMIPPTSSPISLLALNKRLLEGTIYQDGIVLAKPKAPATFSVSKKPKKRSVTVSPFFAVSPSKTTKASDKVSCIPFPPLQSTSFGLVQERLSHDPFHLLIAVIFLNKTRGSVALPVFYELMERYPTPADLAAAKQDDVVEIIQHLGLQNQRAKKCINLAKAWLERPPEKGKRYRVLHYPEKDDGKDVRPGDILNEEDERVAWEIGQLPGIGVYAIDSWRIFCRDELRGLPSGLPQELTPETKDEELQKEWTRVLAGDKELRAYLRWRWLRNGWEWDSTTGERKKAEESELAKADKGGVIYEGDGGDMVVGDVRAEGLEALKAELEIVIAGTAQQQGDEEAEDLTARPQHSEKEQKDSKATKSEPEKPQKTNPEL